MASSSDLFEDSPGEFFISVEVFIHTAATAAFPKASIKSRKLEKRESVGDDLKAKEKVGSGEPFTQGNLSDTGHWRAATCRLTEDKERCILKIYVDDESILHQTIFIHLLNQTDVRPTAQSLFDRKDCISIVSRMCDEGQTPSNATHLAFPSPNTCVTWQALLKSYAIPETYGHHLVPMEGGYYRLWRQVDLTVIQGRNLSPSNSEMAESSDECPEIDMSCEIHLNDILCGCTTVKKGAESTEWHEHFSFPGLPPFKNLEIVVWKDRKSSKPIDLGYICIPLYNFPRGEFVEGLFPVVRRVEALGVEHHLGDLRLKIRVDEEVILPSSCYARLLAACKSRNFLDWISHLESRLKLKDISTHLMSIAISNNTIIDQIQEYVLREVENSPTSQPLFRGNTTLTKVVELSMIKYGMSFLEASVGPVLRRLCSESIAIETEPSRSGRGQKGAEKDMEQLFHWCQEFWNQIYSVRQECPNELRRIFNTIRKVVEQRCRAKSTPGDAQSYLPWQCVSAFVFLRFIVPAILHPHLFGLYPGLLPLSVQRSLTLIARVIQSLANLNVPSNRDNFMRGVQTFLKDNVHGMTDYISAVSTPVKDGKSFGGDDRSRHIRRVKTDLRQRTRTMAALHRQSIPTLPHFLDTPRDLACISSAVVRKSKEPTFETARLGDDVDIAVDEFCARCFEVEEEVFSRVNRVVAKSGTVFTEGAHPSIPDLPRKGSDAYGAPVVASHAQGQKRRNPRPATTAGFESHRQISRNEDGSSNADEYFPATKHQGPRQLNIHTKLPSTDSLPKMVHDTRSLPPATPTIEKEDDTGRWKKGLFRGILKR